MANDLTEATNDELLSSLPIADGGEGGGSRIGGTFTVQAGYDDDIIEFYDEGELIGKVVVTHNHMGKPTVKSYLPEL